MRKLIVVLAVVAMFLSAMPALAQVPTPNGPFTSGFTIQNLTATPATCVFSLYTPAGVSAYTSSNIPVAANGSYFVYVGGLSVASAQYSGVISCDQEVAAVNNNTGPSSASAYAGVTSSAAATTLYAPGVYKNYYGYFSNMVVQNTTGASVNATMHVFNGATEVFSTTKSIAANGSAAFDQNTADFAGLANGLYSAQLTATGAVAAVVSIWNSAGQYFSYDPVANGATVAYAPVIMNNYYAFNTALTVQNLSAVNPAPVTVTYSNGHQTSFSIPAGGSHLFYTPNEGLPAGFLGSAKVQSTGGSILALVNESSAAGPSGNRADSYIGFTQGFSKASAPIVLKAYYSYSTSITCQNIGGSPSTLTATYSNGATQQIASVPSNGTALFYQPNVAGLPAGFNGSAVISTSPASQIVCVANENQVSNTASQDWLLAYTPAGQ